MVFSSNELDFLILQNGDNGVPGESKYIWVKYSNSPDGSGLTDSPDNCAYIGIAYNKDTIEESNNPEDYTWTKMKGDNGLDAYTVILSNENISFPIRYDTLTISDRKEYICDIMVMQGTKERSDFIIGEITPINGLNIKKNDKSVTISVEKGTLLSQKTGEIRIPVSIDGLIFFKNISWNLFEEGKPGVNGEPSLNISIANENQNIPCTSDGKTIDNFLIEIPFAGYIGFEKSPCSVSVGVLPPGITLGSNENATDKKDGRIILNVAKGSNLGSDQTVSGQILLTFTIKEREIVKVFTWSKTKDGGDGNIDLCSIEPSVSVITRKLDGSLDPTTITFNSWVRNSKSVNLNPYEGLFIIEETVNGTVYNSKYISESAESSVVYTPTTQEITAIRCTICKKDNITSTLDRQTIIVLTALDEVNNSITEIKNTVSGVSVKVDAVEKSITDKVWQDDITTQINNYDNSTIKTLRSQVAEQKTEIGRITSEVSDVKTTVEKKADGSTVKALEERVAKNEQTAEGFKQHVKKTYATNDRVDSIESTFNQTAEEIRGTVTNLQGDVSNVSQKVNEFGVTVENVKGEVADLSVKADKVELSVAKKKDVPLISVRYIRDWLNGSNIDTENKWMECKVIVGVDNIALNIIPTSDVDITNPSYYTDGLLTDNQYTTTSTGDHYLQLDLGKIHKDIDYIQIWHDYSSEKYFNNKVEVSEDGQSWHTLYDSKLQGTYKESANGKIHYVNDSDYLTDQLAKIDIDINKVSASVATAEGKISELAVKQNEVELRVSDTEKDITDIVGNMLPDIENQISANQSALEVALESIKSTVTRLEGDVVKQSQEIQDANGWKFIFSSIGVKGEGIPEQETAININGDGLSVTRLEDKGYKTVITGDEFGGYYNNGQDWVKVFSLDEDMVRTKRLMAERGCDFMSLKIVPVDYSSMGVKGLAFVKSGGNS